jgi:hypothetical protein
MTNPSPWVESAREPDRVAFLDGMTKFGRADWSIAGDAAYRTGMME